MIGSLLHKLLDEEDVASHNSTIASETRGDLFVHEISTGKQYRFILSGPQRKAMMGRGEASGEKRVLNAAVAAISNSLIENPSIKRASGLIISITGGKDLSLFEVDEAATRIREEADPDANIIVGASFDEGLEGIVRVSRRRLNPLEHHVIPIASAGAV